TDVGPLVFTMNESKNGFIGKVNFDSTGTMKLNDREYVVIKTQEDLQNIIDTLSNTEKHYVLGNDIDFTERDWVANPWQQIGTNYENNRFSTTLDGLGHSIKGFKMSQKDATT
uniref:hypothetical protein n=1 Tax=Aliarcobacter cryaerophilus TaxID=28198 RepID=UPI001CA335BA